MAGGDSTNDIEEDEDPFQRLMKDYDKNCLENVFSVGSIQAQYLQFRKEGERYRRISSYQKRFLSSNGGKGSFLKDLTVYNSKMTIIIGLEDILASIATVPIENHDMSFNVMKGPIDLGQVYVKFRPYLYEFLDFTAKNFEVIVYCSGSDLYCSPILDEIESTHKYFAHRIYNDHIFLENNSYSIKSYDFLFSRGRTEHNTIIVEHSVASFCLNTANGIVISKFLPEDSGDKELTRLAKCLEELSYKPSMSKYVEGLLFGDEFNVR